MTPARIEKIVIDLVEPKYADATMDDIDEEIKERLRERETYQDVFLWGPAGRGKTHLMAALIRSYASAGYDCMRISFEEFCCKLRSTMTPAATTTEWDLTEELKSVDILFIDDLGIGSKEASDYTYQTFFFMLNKRQERLLPTFISSNKNLDQLQQTLFDERIKSRLSEALIIEMKGEDRRQCKDKGHMKQGKD
jgi:DNA replication protein DnaC